MLSQMSKFIVSDVKVPIAILGAEIDHMSPPEQLKQFGEKLSAKSEVSPKERSSLNPLITIFSLITVKILFQLQTF